MPSIETMHRHDPAILWEVVGYDSENEPIVGAPVEILTRWEDCRKEVLDPKLGMIAIDAMVVVDRRIAVDSQMLQGELADWLGTGSAYDDTNLMRVAVYEEIPDLKGRNVRRTVGLRRFRDTPASRE